MMSYNKTIMTTTSKPHLITTPQQLAALVEKLGAHPAISVDTESNSLHAYRERVCLIQFSIPDGDYLVDPLAIKDLSPLALLFADPEIVKIFHAAEYDLLVLKRDFDYTFKNIFDTMVVARIIGWEKVGLGNILQKEFGVQVEKKFQRANWGKRPLSPEMMRYASMDTHYLIELRQRLQKLLEQQDLVTLAYEDFNRLCCMNGSGPGPQVINIWRMNGSKYLSAQQATILEQLAQYRDGCAARRNIPLFKILDDKVLVRIAETEPSSRAELKEIHSMTPRRMELHASGLLKAVRDGQKLPPTRRPQRPRLPDDQVERLEKLRQWRKTRAKSMGVESDIVLPRDIMEAIAAANPTTKAALAEVMHLVPWRMQQYGDDIQEVLKT